MVLAYCANIAELRRQRLAGHGIGISSRGIVGADNNGAAVICSSGGQKGERIRGSLIMHRQECAKLRNITCIAFGRKTADKLRSEQGAQPNRRTQRSHDVLRKGALVDDNGTSGDLRIRQEKNESTPACRRSGEEPQ